MAFRLFIVVMGSMWSIVKFAGAFDGCCLVFSSFRFRSEGEGTYLGQEAEVYGCV